MYIKAISYFTAAYIVIFAIVAPLTGNREFSLYTVVLGLIMLILVRQRDTLREVANDS